jgi:predicted porin
MKKAIFGAALLAAAGAASAQSSVTLFGVIDTRVAVGRGSIANRTQLASAGMNTPRLGFRGVEDLGGGMSASFWLEGGLNTDNGSGAATNTNNQATGVTGGGGLVFNRRSTVSLASGWGELRAGRDYMPQYWNLLFADPFGNVGVSLPMPATYTFGGLTGYPGANVGVYASNTVSYFTPSSLGGFFGHVQYFFGENLKNGAATEKDGTGAGVRVGYSKGPILASVATGTTKYAAGDVRQSNIVGTYDFGVAKVGAEYSRDKNGAVTGKGWMLGGWVPVGTGEIHAGYSRYELSSAGNPEGKKLALGYVHNLSKRTALYATWARLENSGGAALSLNGAATAPNGSSSGLDLGIRHFF